MSGEAEAGGRPTSPAACEICRTIPDRVSNTTKGDETWGDPLPPAVSRLRIVGAPYYEDDTSRSNWALHKCPLCGAFYSWKFEYEYLTGGSEDSTAFTRLDAATGGRLERECLAEVDAARERSRHKAAAHVAEIVASPDKETISRAARFSNEARRWGFDVDISGAVPALVERLVRLGPDGGEGILPWDIQELLLPWVGTSPVRAEELLRLMRASGVTGPCAQARTVAKHCEGVLAREAAGPR